MRISRPVYDDVTRLVARIEDQGPSSRAGSGHSFRVSLSSDSVSKIFRVDSKSNWIKVIALRSATLLSSTWLPGAIHQRESTMSIIP